MFNNLRKRYVLSISTWFCVPELNMKDLEILCRASAFLVPSLNSYKKSYHICTASHVIAPWRWPKYYSDEWLQQVNENHTFYTVELRDIGNIISNFSTIYVYYIIFPIKCFWKSDGVFMTQLDCSGKHFHHKTRDLAVLHLDDERVIDDVLSRLSVEPVTLSDEKLRLGQV